MPEKKYGLKENDGVAGRCFPYRIFFGVTVFGYVLIVYPRDEACLLYVIIQTDIRIPPFRVTRPGR